MRVVDHCKGGQQIPGTTPRGGGQPTTLHYGAGEHHIDRVSGRGGGDHGERDQRIDLIGSLLDPVSIAHGDKAGFEAYLDATF